MSQTSTSQNLGIRRSPHRVVNTQNAMTKGRATTSNLNMNMSIPQSMISTTKSYSIINQLPSLNTNGISEPNQLAFMKQCFEEFSEAVSRFLINSNSTVAYKEILATSLSDAGRSFNVFYSFLQKQSNNMMSSKSNLKINRNTFFNAASTFSANLRQLIEQIYSIRVSGATDVLNSLRINFNKIKSNLANVYSHPNQHSSVHDPILPLAKDLQNQTLQFKKQIFNIMSNTDLSNQHQILIDMRNFSRDLNTAFTNEFIKCRYGVIENEKMRASSITACNDILQGTKSLITFKSQISTSIVEFENFKIQYNTILACFGLPAFELETASSLKDDTECPNQDKDFNNNINNKNNDENESKEINTSMALKEILKVSYKFLKNDFNKNAYFENFYGVMNEKASLIESDQYDILKQLSELQEKNSELTSHVKKLEKKNQGLQKIVNSFQNDNSADEYLKCIRYVSRRLRNFIKKENSNQEINTIDFSSQQLVTSTNELADALTEYRCPLCAEMEDTEAKVRDLLRGIGGSQEISMVSTAENVKESYDKLSALYQTAKKTLEKYEADNFSNFETILELFPAIKKAADCENRYLGETAEEIIKQVRIERESNKAILINERNLGEQKVIDCEREISEKFATLFGTNSKLPIISQFSQLESEVSSERKTLLDYQSILREVELGISKFLCVQSGYDSITTSISELLTQLAGYCNPLQKVVDSFESQQKDVIFKISKINKKILTILKQSETTSEFAAKGEEITLKESVKFLEITLNELFVDIENNNKNERSKKSFEIKVKANLELIDSKLRNFFSTTTAATATATLANEGLPYSSDRRYENVSVLTIISQIADLVDQVLHIASTNAPLSPRLINKIFENVTPHINHNCDEVNEISKDMKKKKETVLTMDPLKYLPEISFNYAIFQESILSLKPFAEILNRVFQSFDCKTASFLPGTESFTYIRQEVYEMHNALNAIGPSKVHSLLFLVLSRFVALISSFLSAVSSLSFNRGEKDAAMIEEDNEF